jgi:hypothetical protein
MNKLLVALAVLVLAAGAPLRADEKKQAPTGTCNCSKPSDCKEGCSKKCGMNCKKGTPKPPADAPK